MKQIISILMCIVLCLIWTGCTGAENSQPITTSPSAPSDPPEVSAQIMRSVSMVPVVRNTLADDGSILFTRSYHEIRITPANNTVVDTIEADLHSKIHTALASADQLEAIARSEYQGQTDWVPYFLDIRYTPTRIDSTVLSLFGNYSSHSGGNHPALSTRSVTYDLTTGNVLSIRDVLASGAEPTKLAELVNWSLSLSDVNLWYDYEDIVTDLFSGKDGPVDNWYFSQTGLCFHFAPFMIGPYSSGTVIATIPYDKLSGVIQQRFLIAESPQATGSIYARAYDGSVDTPSATVELDANAAAVMLYCDHTVCNVRIETGTWSRDGLRFVPSSTVFAADVMQIEDSILLRADLTNNSVALRLVYDSGDQQICAFIQQDPDGQTITLAK